MNITIWPPMGDARSFGPVTITSAATHVRLGSLPTVSDRRGTGDGGRRRGHLRLVK